MHYLLTVALSAQLAAAADPATVEALRTEARRAEARYERLSRQLAPLSWGGGYGRDCDEVVGRFCLRFDSLSTPPSADEAARVGEARGQAIEAMRRYFAVAPDSLGAAGPLVRLLVRDGRAAEAVPVAERFAGATTDTLMADLMVGFAAHQAGDDVNAERHLVAGLGRLPDDERREWLEPDWLLDPRERSRVRGLPPAARTEYERRFWIVADPLWSTPANERWIEHVSRHVEGKLISESPLVPGMQRWGRDLAELTVRYGTPVSRARAGGAAPSFDAGMVEYWDSAQRAFDPVEMLAGVPPTPAPGERPLLYAATARSSYALQTHGRVLELDHQASRFLRGDSTILRVDAALPLDTAVGAMAATLVIYDSAFTRRREVRGGARVHRDTARLSLALGMAPGVNVYGAEIVGDGVAGRVRYSIGADSAAGGPLLSDLLITSPYPAGLGPASLEDELIRPATSLVFAPGDTIGIYAELYRAGTGEAEIEVGLERAGGRSFLRRFAGWIGRGLGIVGDEAAPRIRWSTTAEDGPHVVALNVRLEDDTGLHELVLRVTPAGSAAAAETRRLIMIRR